MVAVKIFTRFDSATRCLALGMPLSDSLYCFRGEYKGEGGRPVVKRAKKKKSEPQEGIFCKACGRPVTTRSQKIAVNSSHSHTFFNPAGIVYELGCFRKASGCVVQGEPTSEFTWFAGYLWSYSFCRKCKAHLGWYFEQGESGFFGLILNRLQE